MKEQVEAGFVESAKLLLKSEAHLSIAMNHIFTQQETEYNITQLNNELMQNASLQIENVLSSINAFFPTFKKTEDKLLSQIKHTKHQFVTLFGNISQSVEKSNDQLTLLINYTHSDFQNKMKDHFSIFNSSDFALMQSIELNKNNFQESFKNISTNLLASELNLTKLLNSNNIFLNDLFNNVSKDLIKSERNLLNTLNATQLWFNVTLNTITSDLIKSEKALRNFINLTNNQVNNKIDELGFHFLLLIAVIVLVFIIIFCCCCIIQLATGENIDRENLNEEGEHYIYRRTPSEQFRCLRMLCSCFVCRKNRTVNPSLSSPAEEVELNNMRV